MEYKIKCPFCNELNEMDHKFCVYCGKELPLDENAFNLLVDVSQDNNDEKEEFIHCPKCNTLNFKDSIECNSCGFLLQKDIIKSFPVSYYSKYQRCPQCGNILYSNTDSCSLCGYDFLELTDEDDEFFKKYPQYEEYEKNLTFFNNKNRNHYYDSFLYQFQKYCQKNNIDLTFSDIGMIKCPECLDYFSFISPHFMKTHECPHCSGEFTFDIIVDDAYCLNCGKPVKKNQTKCSCGYEFTDIKCPKCSAINQYKDKYCISCDEKLWKPYATFPDTPPQGWVYDNKGLIDEKFLKKTLLDKKFFKIDPLKVNPEELHYKYLKQNEIINEICSRWLIVNPNNCKSCKRIIDPLIEECSICNISHNTYDLNNRVKELKAVKNNYVKSERDIEDLSNLKWNWEYGEKEITDYMNSLAPSIGESRSEYSQRLFKEYAENCVILSLIKIEWNIFFDDYCVNCGMRLGPYNYWCPYCSTQKEVSYLSVLFNYDELLPINSTMYFNFIKKVKNICLDHEADLSYFHAGIIECPECSNYFHYFTSDFLASHRCPHCGVNFIIDD